MIANVTSILNKAPTALLFSRKAKLSAKTKAALTQAFSKEEKALLHPRLSLLTRNVLRPFAAAHEYITEHVLDDIFTLADGKECEYRHRRVA